MDFEYGKNIQNIKKRITDYNLNKIPDISSDSDGEIVIGNKSMNKFGYQKKKEIINKLITIKIMDKDYNFKVVAVFNSEQEDLSGNTIYTNLEVLQDIYGSKSNLIEIKVKNPLDSSSVLINIKPILDKYYPNSSLNDWQDGNRNIVNALYIENISLIIIQSFTALAIGFGIYSLFMIIIKERFSQIGILKSLGLNNYDVLIIFLYFIIILTFLGCIFGLLFGDFVSRLFMIIFRRETINAPLVSINKGIFNYYTLISFIVIFLSSLLSSIIPLRRIKKLRIIEVIKNE